MTGLSVVLLTGWMLLDSKMVVLGGQAVATTPQALGASSQVLSTQLAYKQGDTVTLINDIPLFKNRRDGSVAADQLGIEYYTTKTKSIRWPRFEASGYSLSQPSMETFGCQVGMH